MRYLTILGIVALACLPAGAVDLDAVESWAVVLQEPDLDELADSDYDLVVIDYSYDGSESGEFSAADIAALKASGKTVLAYFSIGEAEDYRFYWQSSWKPGKPGYISDENPDWPGNYAVKFWNKNWWNKALRPYLDRIINAGFDGVYLDKVDAYWWWHDEKGVPYRKSANRMAKLVEKVHNHAGGDFVVCMQNGASLWDDCSTKWRNRLLASIDMVAVENLYYDYWTEADRDYRIDKLEQYEGEGKRILVLEYIDESEWDEFKLLLPDGWLGYAADPDLALDELIYFE